MLRERNARNTLTLLQRRCVISEIGTFWKCTTHLFTAHDSVYRHLFYWIFASMRSPPGTPPIPALREKWRGNLIVGGSSTHRFWGIYQILRIIHTVSRAVVREGNFWGDPRRPSSLGMWDRKYWYKSYASSDSSVFVLSVKLVRYSLPVISAASLSDFNLYLLRNSNQVQ